MSDPVKSDAAPIGNLQLDDVLSSFRHTAHNEHLLTLSDSDVEALARSIASFAQDYSGEAPLVRVRDGRGADDRLTGTSVLETITRDKPFLVDSLLGLCADMGLEVRALFHPILETDEGSELSLIQIHVPALSAAEGRAFKEGADATLADVALAVQDFAGMQARMQREINRLNDEKHCPREAREEAVAFLDWLQDEHFVFLGVRDYEFETGPDGEVLAAEPIMVEGSNLGILRDEDTNVLNSGAEPLVLSPEIGTFLSEPDPIIVAKSTHRSRVHRRAQCDYIGVKHFDSDGNVTGETRFLGLYTAEAYNQSVRAIPLVRQRVARVLEAANAVEGSHNYKALSNILETWPRDELLQADADTLIPLMQGALQLVGRPRTRVFVRRDQFNRFVSVLVFAPREAYDSTVRVRIAERLTEAYQGRLISFQPRFDASPLARVHLLIELTDDKVEPDLKALEADVAAIARTWDDAFREALTQADMSEADFERASAFRGAFNAAYREAFSPQEAIADVFVMRDLDEAHPIRMRAYRPDGDDSDVVCAKIYSRNGSIPLSNCVPVFENMGLFVEFETGYPVEPNPKPAENGPDVYWVHSLRMRSANQASLDLEEIGAGFEDAFVAIWQGLTENDRFNGLVFSAGASWREAALCRALCGYRHQTGLDPARATQIEALKRHPKLTRALLDLFTIRFDPTSGTSLDERLKAAKEMVTQIETRLNEVSSLDEDRVIRRIAHLIMAIQRTNFWQRRPDGSPHPFISFKIASQEISDLPAPKPFREIFMSCPEVEGVHCRFGAVARGGLRWSDRRDDFRTEVLGLVKAQQVKNAVIVPVGSKGGFFPKQIPANATREERNQAGISAYKTFINALLDLTGNLIDGNVQQPKDTVVWDGDDPYLVVAADKGTATFSDIANEISLEHGFWLGDAFASGGSAGYDHKKMGITARGAWEAVKRHFREMGKDIQTEPFTVIGCGDMSGDVFGNGMLLSKQIQLKAAFNHLHIFVDPDPVDTERLWEERKRLFDLPRSSWSDYDESLISEGGGIFERSAKSIPLSDQMKKMTGLSGDSATPDEFLHALLKAECELLWFGGIGTYVKASHETPGDAGDRANDAIRVNGRALKAKVIGEGANLGLTQAGRIEFALNGGRINTDAIDNSAGVDSSDHEVNIKILCSEAIRRKSLPSGRRNHLLAEMTDDVAAHVLAHNYSQTGALTLAESTAARDHEANERLMCYLEDRGGLDRQVEGLPNTSQMHERGENKVWLSRPELAVLMAWSKITLFDDLVASDVPDDPWFLQTLESYFPEPLHKFEDAMQVHRLRREIIATVLANRLIDAGGPLMLLRLRERTGASNAALCRVFETARVLLSHADYRAEIEALDNKVSASTQTELYQLGAEAAADVSAALLRRAPDMPVTDAVESFRPFFETLDKSLAEALSGFEATQYRKRVNTLSNAGINDDLAARAALMPLLPMGVDLRSLASDADAKTEAALDAYLRMGETLRLDRLRHEAARDIDNASYWERLATRRLVEDLRRHQAHASAEALQSGDVSDWLSAREAERRALIKQLNALSSAKANFAQFTLAADAVRSFMSGTSHPGG
ncbi:NAD-glutamate dehydrogenase [Henriciella litoralis]|uniref:NAD-glutamate dehydrogenase n=1 Tax=Henriciella litoralis TaxID=568102 RepID=UPI0009FCA952|nr:NAD-glutamate dehydrogenase [Henriciella litoralis]